MTPEQKAAWLQKRCGKLSASVMADAMDYTKAGKPGARRTALMKKLIGHFINSMVHIAAVPVMMPTQTPKVLVRFVSSASTMTQPTPPPINITTLLTVSQIEVIFQVDMYQAPAVAMTP
jgi:hypothetical protein